MATTGDRLTTSEANVTVQKGSKVLTPPARTRPTTPAEQEVDTVQVWPHLVVIEFLAAVILTINIVLISTLFNSPLLGLANPDKTPNPSKAPWYFLNLQELLLHMNPALAGVIIPTVALGLIAIIPYVDRGTKGLGVWFYSARGPRIAIFTTIYTIVICAVLIALDKFFPLKPAFQSLFQIADLEKGTSSGFASGLTEFVAGFFSTTTANSEAQTFLVELFQAWLLPIFFFLFFPTLLVILLRVVFRGIDLSEVILALFTGFFVVYYTLTFVGTFMRGPGMDLYPPWALPPTVE
jgi:menaquinol-cytochrome c reductase cytochrome b/c subunit